MAVGKAVTDEALLSAAAQGSLPAFDSLVRRHTGKMYRVAYRILRDAADAEDVVQDAWVSAWRALSKFRGDSAVSTWLYRVTTNTALAHLRRRRATVALDTTLVEELHAHVTPHDPEPSAMRGEQIDAVLAAIDTLDESQRLPLVLHELEGLDYEQIARMLGVSVPALRSRLHRARAALLIKLRELR